MTVEKMRDFYQAEPFRPFIIHLADGRQIPVVHREFIAAAPSGRTLAIYQPDDTFNLIDPLLVTDIEVKPETSRGGCSMVVSSAGI
jgi:hypothetical protein